MVRARGPICTIYRVTWYLRLLALSILTCSPNLSFVARLISYRTGSLEKLQFQKHHLPAEWKHHLHRGYDVATIQSRLEPGRLCYGEPCSCSVLRWQFETIEQLKQAIVDDLCVLSYKFIDCSVNECRRHLECPAEWQTYWTYFKKK